MATDGSQRPTPPAGLSKISIGGLIQRVEQAKCNLQGILNQGICYDRCEEVIKRSRDIKVAYYDLCDAYQVLQRHYSDVHAHPDIINALLVEKNYMYQLIVSELKELELVAPDLNVGNLTNVNENFQYKYKQR